MVVSRSDSGVSNVSRLQTPSATKSEPCFSSFFRGRRKGTGQVWDRKKKRHCLGKSNHPFAPGSRVADGPKRTDELVDGWVDGLPTVDDGRSQSQVDQIYRLIARVTNVCAEECLSLCLCLCHRLLSSLLRSAVRVVRRRDKGSTGREGRFFFCKPLFLSHLDL